MKLIPIRTNIFTPPHDDLFEIIETPLDGKIREGDIVVVTSKVVAIHEGRCVAMGEKVSKERLIKKEADAFYVPRKKGARPLTIKHNALISASGIDESNAGGYYVLLPKDPAKSAHCIRSFICGRWGLKNVGVIITDSHSTPLRYGATGIAIGFSGFLPIKSFVGDTDLFGREFKYTKINLVDSIATSAVLVMGETTEQTPLCIVRDAPHITFREGDHHKELFVQPKEDIYYPLIEKFYTKRKKRRN